MLHRLDVPPANSLALSRPNDMANINIDINLRLNWVEPAFFSMAAVKVLWKVKKKRTRKIRENAANSGEKQKALAHIVYHCATRKRQKRKWKMPPAGLSECCHSCHSPLLTPCSPISPASVMQVKNHHKESVVRLVFILYYSYLSLFEQTSSTLYNKTATQIAYNMIWWYNFRDFPIEAHNTVIPRNKFELGLFTLGSRVSSQVIIMLGLQPAIS